MKKTILTSLLTVIFLTMTAQEKLIRIDSEDIAWVILAVATPSSVQNSNMLPQT